MELPLVVGVDGSDSSLGAAEWAANEAVRHGWPMWLVYASMWGLYEGPAAESSDRPAERAFAENIVSIAGQRVQARAPDVKVGTEIVPQDATTALVEGSRHAVALVTGSRGRGEVAGLLLGSVSLSVAARAQCPVIVVRGDGDGVDGRHGRILLGVGDGEVDSPAVRFAFQEAAARSCVLDVVHAWRRPMSEELAVVDRKVPAEDTRRRHLEDATAVLQDSIDAAARAHPDVRVHTATAEGSAHHVLPARTAAADLLVVGARRVKSQFGTQLGHVAHRALHHALCPVAVVPQPPDRAEERQADTWSGRPVMRPGFTG